MTTATISVPEIHCDHCKRSIEGALLLLGGVAGAEVDVAARTVTVSYDQTAVAMADLAGAIRDQGYDVPAR